ncbi:MAG: ThiF family adenylyltransferase [Candidatus Omnitrophica bacterium]|nr:ThiF family adenylyltransferase [Candidatus Omnitrophota bacterium]
MQEFSRYERQWILKEIGREGQARLARSKVAVMGLGALGSVSANLLARAGVGNLLLIDRDFVELNNLQRQILYEEQDARENLPKAVAAREKLSRVNSEIRIESEVADINSETIEELLKGVHLIVDGTDNFETRFLINDYSLKFRIPWIYGGAVRTEGMSYFIFPHEGPCLRCLFPEPPAVGSQQTCDQVGILAPVTHLIASFQATEAIKYLAGCAEDVERRLWKVDLWSRRFRAVSMEPLKKNPCSGCRQEDYPYLNQTLSTRTVKLCGRNAVQIYRKNPEDLDLRGLAARLLPKGAVTLNPYLLKVSAQPYEITVFSNGRVMVKGTEDENKAKSLYAQYIGT